MKSSNHDPFFAPALSREEPSRAGVSGTETPRPDRNFTPARRTPYVDSPALGEGDDGAAG
jgi:hypothetical protein